MIQKVDIGQPVHLYEILDEVHATSSPSYLLPNYTPNQNSVLEIKYKCNGNFRSNYNQRILFTKYASWNTSGCIGIAYENGSPGYLTVKFNTSSSYEMTNTGIVWDNTTPHIIKYDMNNLYYDGDIVATRTMTYGTPSNELLLSTVNISNSSIDQGYYSFYYFNIYESGDLIHEFVPVRRISDDAIGFYDKQNDNFIAWQGGVAYTSKQTPEYIDEQHTGTLYVNDIIKSGVTQTSHVYEILDYIISPSNSIIDTGITVNDNVVVDATINFTQRGYDNARIFSTSDGGSDAWGNPGVWGLQIESSGSVLSIAPLGIQNTVTQTSFRITSMVNNKYRYSLTSKGVLNVYDDADNVVYNYDAGYNSYTTSTTLTLFGTLLYSNAAIPANARIYSVKIWKDSVLVRDYIPVKRLSDNVCGMYDNVNKTFHQNEVSGYSFSGTSQETPEYIDETTTSTIHINKIYHNGTIYWGGGPLDLTQVDYIEPTGDWTNHGVPYPTTLLFSTVGVPLSWDANNTDNITIDCDITVQSDYCGYYSNSALFGQHAMNGTQSIGGIARAIGLVYGNVNQNRLVTEYKYIDASDTCNLNNFISSGRCNIHIENGHCVIKKRSDNTVIYDVDTQNAIYGSYNLKKFYLFGAEVERSTVPIVCQKYRLHYFKIYKNNNLIYDFEPVYNNVTNEYGVHDKLHHQFYASESTTYPFTGPQIQ